MSGNEPTAWHGLAYIPAAWSRNRVLAMANNKDHGDERARAAEREVLLADFNTLNAERRAVVLRAARDQAISQARHDKDAAAVEGAGR